VAHAEFVVQSPGPLTLPALRQRGRPTQGYERAVLTGLHRDSRFKQGILHDPAHFEAKFTTLGDTVEDLSW
jgi:hypothetical protein